jgi:hypothetical protein
MIRLYSKTVHTRVVPSLPAFLTTNHCLSGVGASGGKMRDSDFIHFETPKTTITRLASTNISQNPPRFLAIFVDFRAQNDPISTQNGLFSPPPFRCRRMAGRPRYDGRYGVPLKSFVLKYGGMAYRGEGAGSYQKVNTAPSSTSAANHASTASSANSRHRAESRRLKLASSLACQPASVFPCSLFPWSLGPCSPLSAPSRFREQPTR